MQLLAVWSTSVYQLPPLKFTGWSSALAIGSVWCIAYCWHHVPGPLSVNEEFEFRVSGPATWYRLPASLSSSDSTLLTFKSRLKTSLFQHWYVGTAVLSNTARRRCGCFNDGGGIPIFRVKSNMSIYFTVFCVGGNSQIFSYPVSIVCSHEANTVRILKRCDGRKLERWGTGCENRLMKCSAVSAQVTRATNEEIDGRTVWQKCRATRNKKNLVKSARRWLFLLSSLSEALTVR